MAGPDMLAGVFDSLSLRRPEGYVVNDDLRAAVQVALQSGRPLLLTGEPGTGKTQLAARLAYERGIPLLEFHTRSSSIARDLFYQYDALRHFHASHFEQVPRRVEEFITYQALGLAILMTRASEQPGPILPEPHEQGRPTQSVVLVDEIDKAPRDFPNDLLDEIERLHFTVAETGQRFDCEVERRPVLVITSNSERTLPDAFLRRCAFYHLQFPDTESLLRITANRLRPVAESAEIRRRRAIERFEEIRNLQMRKRPATAELLDWLAYLESREIDVTDPQRQQTNELKHSYCLLAKNPDDLRLLWDRYDFI
jgi:MoxR-like ATPase